jgi:hypothetical protein
MSFGKLSALFILCSMVAAGLQAQATRTWVSGVGDDVNPCSRTAPCKTWAGAISKTAAGGEINALDSGGFGALNITKSLTINGAGVHASTLANFGINGFIVNAPSTAVVTLRNLSINGTGTTLGLNGIRFIAGKTLIIENCDITNFSNRGISAEVTTGASLIVTDTVIRNIGTTGIVALPSSGSNAINVLLDNVRIYSSLNGVYIGNGAKAIIRNSSISRNTGFGVQVEQSGAFNTEATIDSTTISSNAIGITAGVGATETRISNCVISGNTGTGISLAGGTVISHGNNMIRNNAGSNTPSSLAVPALQ